MSGDDLSQPRASAVREHKVELLSRSAVLELRLTQRAELTMIAVVDQPSGDVELGSTMVSPLIPAAVAVDLVAADLEKMRGVVVRQETQFLESFAQGLGLPYEAKNRYKVSALPEGRAVATSPTDAARWRTLWASAVAETSLSSELGAVRDASLARTLDQQFADQAALKASTAASWTSWR